MNQNLNAPCGLNCALCDMYLATQANDDELRQEIADKWSELFHHPFKKEDINCDGCLGGSRRSLYCQNLCEIRPCALSKGLTDCKDCPDYLCPKLQKNQEASAVYVH